MSWTLRPHRAAVWGLCSGACLRVFFVILTLARTSNKKREDISCTFKKKKRPHYFLNKGSKERTVLKTQRQIRSQTDIFCLFCVTHFLMRVCSIVFLLGVHLCLPSLRTLQFPHRNNLRQWATFGTCSKFAAVAISCLVSSQPCNLTGWRCIWR